MHDTGAYHTTTSPPATGRPARPRPRHACIHAPATDCSRMRTDSAASEPASACTGSRLVYTHVPPCRMVQDPGDDGDTQNLLGDSQRAARLRRRRMFLRSQPFFWQPHGQAYRRTGGSLLLRAAAAHALLATLSLLFLLRACLPWRPGPGAPPLGEQSLEQLWKMPLPQQAPQWLQGMLLLFVQQVTALTFAFAYGIWRCAPPRPGTWLIHTHTALNAFSSALVPCSLRGTHGHHRHQA